MKLLFCFISILLPLKVLAWSGYDYETGAYVDIGSGNLVRSGNEIEIYDYNDDSYHDVEVISVSSNKVEVYDNETGDYRTLNMRTNADIAAYNKILNEYASEISRVKRAYDKGQISLLRMEELIRVITNKYQNENKVNVKALNSVRDSTVGVDVSGKLLEQEFNRQWNEEERRRTQKRKAIDDYKTKTDNEHVTDEFAIAQIQKNQEYSANLQTALGNFLLAKETNDTSLVESAQNSLRNNTVKLDELLLTQGLAKNFDGMLTVEAYETVRGDLIKFNMSQGLDYSNAQWSADETLKAVGYKQAVDDNLRAVKNIQVSQESYNKAILTSQQHNITTNIPTITKLAAFEEMAPGMLANLAADNLIDNDLVEQLNKYFKGEPVDNTGNVNATKATGSVLNALIKGYRAGKVEEQ